MYFFIHLWPGLVVWTALYTSDIYLTITCAKLYQAGVKEKFVVEGSYELTPYYQKDVDSLRIFSSRFFWMLCLTLATLSAVWWLVKQSLLPPGYPLVLGYFILVQLVVHRRHLRNLLLFRAITKDGAVRGRIEYSRRLMLRQSALDLVYFASLFALLSLATYSLFILGGALGCFLTAVKHWQLARKQASDLAVAQSQ